MWLHSFQEPMLLISLLFFHKYVENMLHTIIYLSIQPSNKHSLTAQQKKMVGTLTNAGDSKLEPFSIKILCIYNILLSTSLAMLTDMEMTTDRGQFLNETKPTPSDYYIFLYTHLNLTFYHTKNILRLF